MWIFRKIPKSWQRRLHLSDAGSCRPTDLGSASADEHWWLSAASGGQFEEVEVKEGNEVVGRLPFVIARKAGFRVMRQPAFTHLLGPIVDAGPGKHQTRLKNRIRITRDLIDQLPPFDCFKQGIDSSIDDGLAVADGLAFQERGFQVSLQYTFQIDCRNTLKQLFNDMHTGVRQRIRRAEEAYTVQTVDDPGRFVDFYLKNLGKTGRKSNIPFDAFNAVFSECAARNCGEIIAAVQPDGTPLAMTFLVWGNGVMYYLMTTRAQDAQDTGSVNLLIWTAMKKAHELGLVFDLDGVTTYGTARFLSGFGGQIQTRLIIAHARPIYATLQHFGRMAGVVWSSNYT
jgi:hypothetical protein